MTIKCEICGKEDIKNESGLIAHQRSKACQAKASELKETPVNEDAKDKSSDVKTDEELLNDPAVAALLAKMMEARASEPKPDLEVSLEKDQFNETTWNDGNITNIELEDQSLSPIWKLEKNLNEIALNGGRMMRYSDVKNMCNLGLAYGGTSDDQTKADDEYVVLDRSSTHKLFLIGMPKDKLAAREKYYASKSASAEQIGNDEKRKLGNSAIGTVKQDFK